MAFSASVRDNAVAEINITPLVDVMLVLSRRSYDDP